VKKFASHSNGCSKDVILASNDLLKMKGIDRNPSHSISWDFRFLNQGMLLEKNHDIFTNLAADILSFVVKFQNGEFSEKFQKKYKKININTKFISKNTRLFFFELE